MLITKYSVVSNTIPSIYPSKPSSALVLGSWVASDLRICRSLYQSMLQQKCQPTLHVNACLFFTGAGRVFTPVRAHVSSVRASNVVVVGQVISSPGLK